MDLTQLKRFVAVHDCGSLAKAAQSLNISQPGLSKSIRLLETELGAKLFERGPKGIKPTPFGNTVYSRARKMLGEWLNLESERVALLSGRSGHVTVGIARGIGFVGRVMPVASAKLSTSEYSVRLTVISGVAEELIGALKSGEVDFAVAVLDSVGERDLVKETLFYDRSGLFVNSDHVLARRRAASIEELVNYCWMFSSDATPMRDALYGLAKSRGVEPRNTVIDSNSVVYLSSTLIDGDFVGILSMDSVEDLVNSGKLVEVVLEPAQRTKLALTAVERPIGFLRRADTTLSPVALALKEEIRIQCNKLGYPLVAKP